MLAFRFPGSAVLAGAVSVAVAGLAAFAAPNGHRDPVTLVRLGTIQGAGAEIVSYDPGSQRLFVSTISGQRVDIVDARDPYHLRPAGSVDLSGYGAEVTSVDIGRGLVAAAVKADPAQQPGTVVFFTPAGEIRGSVTVGAGPDMVTFTPDGRRVLVANEGEPEGYCEGQVDPEGSISVVDVTGPLTQAAVRTAGFGASEIDPSVRISGPVATPAQDLEPEYIAVAPDGRTGYVSLQENNALALLDIRAARVTRVVGLGFKDHSLPGYGLDPSDRDGGVHIAPWPVRGLYMPDAVAAYHARGKTYLVLANEGDARDYDCHLDEVRISAIDPAELPPGVAPELQDPAALGRLKVVNTTPSQEGLFSYGGRSFSIRDSAGRLVFDSGEALERLTAEQVPALFNSEEGDLSTFDTRSDDKGPEPEALALGRVDGRQLAFVGLERTGGIVVYDLSDPRSPRFQSYLNSAGDVAPEGMHFIGADDSPTGRPLLAVAHEVSATTTLFEIR